MSVLEVDGLTKQFGQLVAVDDVTLEVDRGEIRSIIGPNGAGKSTFFNLITGLMLPTDGTVTFDGEDITGLKPFEIARRGVARSFQITDVFGGLTAFENVRIAAQVGHDKRDSFFAHADDIESVNEVAHRVLEDIELADRADQRAGDFAYGDRRKLEIGLTIANDPDLLLLDEPTAGMSREETISAIRMIRRLADEREFTLMLIEHDLEVVMNISDRVTVLQDGGVIAEGPPDRVRQDEIVREAYIGGALS
ncbi:MAG: ABC transporter ATP-binding protein [Halobacteriales archaeon]|nr:ABC transporter ATP-binding protein [Halobacteriales archaeon]